MRVRIIGTRAESLSQYLRKGSRVYVDGRLEARPWMNRDNQPLAGLEILADTIEFMSSRQDDRTHGPARPADARGGGRRRWRSPIRSPARR